ncbi:MAG TPA: hypothetical protein VEA35_02545 [Ramlibacter sp.]|nr:hypothetical protein [Ramlibacter sp.]
MNTVLACGLAALLMTGCAVTRGQAQEDVTRGGYASPTGAAFMGYHGPMDRLHKPED